MAGKRKFEIPTKEQLESVYPKLTIKEAGEHFGVGQTLMLKWLAHHDIPRSKKLREQRSAEHTQKIVAAKANKPRKLRGTTIECPTCGIDFYLRPSLVNSSGKNYCSVSCRGKAKRIKTSSRKCEFCGENFFRGETSAGNWKNKKFCSVKCATSANPPPTYFGSDNPRYKGETARRKSRKGPYASWRKTVLARDQLTCQRCGITDVTLTAHHILPWETHPEKRFDVLNGLTLCQPCHFREHGYDLNKHGVSEITDERGIVVRHWIGECLNCSTTIVRRASDMKRADGSARDYGFCSHSCKQKLRLMEPSAPRCKGIFRLKITAITMPAF